MSMCTPSTRCVVFYAPRDFATLLMFCRGGKGKGRSKGGRGAQAESRRKRTPS
jgi:hypothetical protein